MAINVGESYGKKNQCANILTLFNTFLSLSHSLAKATFGHERVNVNVKIGVLIFSKNIDFC